MHSSSRAPCKMVRRWSFARSSASGAVSISHEELISSSTLLRPLRITMFTKK
jgi:hypothetical protein